MAPTLEKLHRSGDLMAATLESMRSMIINRLKASEGALESGQRALQSYGSLSGRFLNGGAAYTKNERDT